MNVRTLRVKGLAAGSVSGRLAIVGPAESFSEVKEFDEVVLLDEDDPEVEVGRAQARDLWSGALAEVPASILEAEARPLFRTYSGLAIGLRLAGNRVAPATVVEALILEAL